MTIKTVLLATGVFAMSLAACGGKTNTPGAAAPAPASAPAASAPGPAINGGTPVDGAATLKAPATAGAGAQIEVIWTGPANAGDYIDLVPRGSTQTSGEITYSSIPNSLPVAKLRMPVAVGEYDVRYIVALASERKIKAVAPLTVTAVEATMTVPIEAGAAEILSIAWTGPNGTGDYIDIVPAGETATSGEITYAYTSAGTPAKVTAPGTAGNYDVRYILEGTGGRKVLSSSRLKVTMPESTLKAPDRVAPGETFIVEWTGPKRAGDYVDLVKKGYMPTSGELTYFYANPNTPNQMKAPAEAGDYEIRYVMEAPKQRVILAKRPVTVK